MKKKIIKLKNTIKGPSRPAPHGAKNVAGGPNGGHNNGGK